VTPACTRALRIGALAGTAVLLSAGATFVGRDGSQRSATTATTQVDRRNLLPPLPSNEDAGRDMLQLAGPAARLFESAHFAIAHTGPTDGAAALGRRLEALYQAHVRLVRDWDLPVHRPPSKLEVCFFARYDEFKSHLDRRFPDAAGVLGFYDPGSNRTYLFDLETAPAVVAIRAEVAQTQPAARDRVARRVAWLERSIIQHEAAHQVEFNIGLFPSAAAAPRWLTEGLATLFELPLAASGQPLEPLNGYRLYEFRKLYGGGVETLGDVRRFLADDEAWSGGRSYPLAWALAHYLREEHHAFLGTLLREVGAGHFPTSAAEREPILSGWFGPFNAQWVARFYEATMRLPLDASTFTD